MVTSTQSVRPKIITRTELGLRCEGRGASSTPAEIYSKRVFEKSRFCHISPTMFPIPASKQLGRTLVRTVSLDLPGLFKHPLSITHARIDRLNWRFRVSDLDAYLSRFTVRAKAVY